MTVKEWFEQVWYIDGEIKALKREMENAKECALSVGESSFSVKVQTSKKGGKEDAIVRFLDYSSALKDKIEELFKVKMQVFKVIERIENSNYRRLLTLRYLSLFTWEKVSEEMELDLRHIYRVHNKALKSAEPLVFEYLCDI